MTIKAGVIGTPISHSLSPVIHNYWLEKYGIDGSYDAIEVSVEDFPDFIENVGRNGFNGVNITLPHKETALQLMANVDPFATFIGAVNTVIVNMEGVLGTNTDFVGFARNLMDFAPDFAYEGATAMVLGAGGASRAIIFALLSMKVKHIIITNRTREKAEAIAGQAQAHMGVGEDVISIVDWDEKDAALKDVDILVNTTSLGMVKQPELEISLDALPKESLVTDIVYNPLETSLLKAARERGNITVDGIGMLLHQAAPGFEAWFGQKPEVDDDLRQTVLAAL